MEYIRYEIVCYPNVEEKVGDVVEHINGLSPARAEVDRMNQSRAKEELEMGIFYDFRGPYPPLSPPQRPQRPQRGASPKRRPNARYRRR